MTHTAIEAGARALLRVAARYNLTPSQTFAEQAALAVLTAQDSVKGRPVARGSVRLSGRRLEALRLAAQGLSNAEIGARMFITEDTVKSTLRAAFRALGATSRAHAVAIAMAHGLIRDTDVVPRETARWVA